MLEKIQGQVDNCVPLMNRLNSLLPERFEVVDTSEYHNPGDAMNYSEQDNIIGFNYSNMDTDSLQWNNFINNYCMHIPICTHMHACTHTVWHENFTWN